MENKRKPTNFKEAWATMPGVEQTKARTATMWELDEVWKFMTADTPDLKEYGSNVLANIAVFEKYKQDHGETPGYRGPLYIIVWPHSPVNITILGRRRGRLFILQEYACGGPPPILNPVLTN